MASSATLAGMPRERRERPWWLWLLICVAMLLYALLFGEMFLRLLHPQALVPRYVTGGADGVRANMAHVTFRQSTPEVDVMLRYNAAGMRDDRPPPPLAKAPGECRVAVLGDSFFVGFESATADSFASRLEAELSRRGRPCRVLNFAVSGLGHAENLVVLERRARAYAPDLVLVSVHATDGLDNLRANLFRPTPDGLEPTGNNYLPGIAISDRLMRLPLYPWVQENSHLYSALRETAGAVGKRLLAMLRGRGAAAEAEAPAVQEPAEEAPAGFVGDQRLNRAVAARLAADAGAMGARLMLFEIPTSGSRTRYVPVAEALLGADLLAAIPNASPLGRFQAMQGPDVQLYLEKGHRHWTALGNKVAAEVAADAIMKQGLVPPPTSDE